jgi:very-short-patch-repair endonuclease
MTKEEQKLRQDRNNKFRKILISRPTKAELAFKDILDELKIRYLFQKGFFKGKYHCIVDFYIPSPFKVCIEIDGEYHHSPDIVRKDRMKNYYLEEFRGFKVLRFNNSEVLSNKDEVIKKIIICVSNAKKENSPQSRWLK